MTEREKHEAIVIAAFDVAHSMFERAVLAWDFFGDDERKKIIDAVLAEAKRVGLGQESAAFSGKPLMTDMTVDEVLQNIQAKCEQYMDVGTLHPAELDNVLLFIWRHANELKGRGLVGRAESQNRTIDEFYGIGRANPPREDRCPECGTLHYGKDQRKIACPMVRDRRGGWRQLGVCG
jgi:hypothetical protein